MQTFLPYPDFTQSAACLDNRRLGKQRVECMQILRALALESGGYFKHPATQMWYEYESCLVQYACTICSEWVKRGYEDGVLDQIKDLAKLFDDCSRYPWWLGYSIFHESHRSNLLRKDSTHYSRFGWSCSPDLPYFWPSKTQRVM